jgi:hypothetical protein
MIRLGCAIAVAALACMASIGVAEAAPIAPLPSALTNDTGNVTPVYYYHGRYYRYRWHGHYYAHRHWYHRHWRYY